MPNTYTQLYIHIVFAVKGRQHFITEAYREAIQKYISGIISNKNQKLYAIFCMPDHTHIFVSLQPNIATSDLVRDIKSNSTAWIKFTFSSLKSFAWQEGFGAFSYSKSQADNVVSYIVNQPKHHKKKTFRQEYIEFLKAFDIAFDNKYLFEFYDEECIAPTELK
jgi:REP element-mobilizing transposase RayT